jgi:CheY-like chemotaxis protein
MQVQTRSGAMEEIVRHNDAIRVLIVEDEFLIAEWTAEALSDLGFVVETVGNARDALRHLASAPVDVLFTDINLAGGMDGTALARLAREMLPHLPVVYASARVAPDARVPGAIFVRKPYEPEAVGKLIAGAVKSAVPVPA